jgi:hypothetical protein
LTGGESLGLNEDETAFYDSALQVLGEPTLKTIARELMTAMKKNVTIDWTVRENVRAKLRVIVKRILKRYGYPPDKQERATQSALEQAEALSERRDTERQLDAIVWPRSATRSIRTEPIISDVLTVHRPTAIRARNPSRCYPGATPAKKQKRPARRQAVDLFGCGGLQPDPSTGAVLSSE